MSLDPVSSPESLAAAGAILRRTREARGLTLSEAAHDIYIRSVYLEAIEAGDLSRLPEIVYTSGFIKRYAIYLGLDGEAFLDQMLPLLHQIPVQEEIPPQPTRSQQPPKLTLRLKPLHLWTGYVLLVIGAIQGLSMLLSGDGDGLGNWLAPARLWQRFSWNSGSNGSDLASSQRVFPTLEQWTYIAGVFPTPPPTPVATPIPPEKPVQLDIRVVERASWLRVIADGRTVFEDTLQPGSERNWTADESIVVRAGNAGGVLLTFNNQDLGVMGGFGEVKEQVFQRPQP